MKGDIYNYEGKEYIMQNKYFDEYVTKTGVDLEKEYSAEESTKIINSNVMAVYEGIFTCKEPFTGKEICELLSNVSEQFDCRLDAVLGED